MLFPSRRCTFAVLSTITALAVPTAASAAKNDAASPADVTVTTIFGYQVSLHGPDNSSEVGKVPTEVVVRDRDGKVIQKLFPESDLKPYGCRTTGRPNCVPTRAQNPATTVIGEQGLMVYDELLDPPGLAVQMKRAGVHCCQLLAGYLPAQDGTYYASIFNSGATRLLTAQSATRIRVGDPGWDRLDWPIAHSRPAYHWLTLDPSEGWTDVTLDDQNREQLHHIVRTLHTTRSPRTAQSRRALEIYYRLTLGMTTTAAQRIRSYRRRYGDRSASRLTRLLAKTANNDAAMTRSIRSLKSARR